MVRTTWVIRHFLVAGAVGLLLGFLNGRAMGQSWQEKLQGLFDHVETFDELQDWSGTKPTNQVYRTEYASDFPRKLDGSDSMWDYYSNYNQEDHDYLWIADHGSDNVWHGTGKAFCLDYHGVRGPSRLGFHIGDSPNDGYPNDVYVFFMNKYFKDFFPNEGGNFQYHGFMKTFQISTGFRDIGNWGTVTEQTLAQVNGAKNQVLYTYGLNFVVMNFSTVNSREVGKYASHTAQADNSAYHYEYEGRATGADYSDPILNSEWFGIEYHFVKSDPPGADNGLIEIWVYDKEGNIIGYDRLENTVTFRDGATPFDHSWNKFVWGGNRHYTKFENQPISHLYLDDIIVNQGRIGPSYFTILEGTLPEFGGTSSDTLHREKKSIVIEGVNFGSDMNAATLELADADAYAQTTTRIPQPIQSLSDTALVFDANVEGLDDRSGTYYLFFASADGVRTPQGYPIYYRGNPVIQEVSPDTLAAGMQNIEVHGRNLGRTSVKLELANAEDYAQATNLVVQPLLAASDTLLTFNVNLAGLETHLGEQLYLFVTGSPYGLRTQSGYPVQTQSITTDLTNPNNGPPESFALHQNYPNPFNPSTVISYRLPRRTHVELTVYNLRGEEVRTLVDQSQSAGEHKVEFTAINLANGVYVYTLKAGGQSLVRKLVLLK